MTYNSCSGSPHSLTSAGDVADEVPGFDEVGFFALQPDDTLIRSLLKVLLLIEALL